MQVGDRVLAVDTGFGFFEKGDKGVIVEDLGDSLCVLWDESPTVDSDKGYEGIPGQWFAAAEDLVVLADRLKALEKELEQANKDVLYENDLFIEWRQRAEEAEQQLEQVKRILLREHDPSCGRGCDCEAILIEDALQAILDKE